MASQDWFDKDFYKVLGVDKGVSAADLKKTYRKLARQYHPDSNPGDAKAEAKFKEISEAYAVLNDPEQREEYDQIRAMGSGARFSAPGTGGGGGFDDVFSRFGQQRGGASAPGGFDDFFSMFDQQGGGFGSGRFGQTTGGYRGFGGPQRGADVTARTTLDFVTAAKGETITLQGEDGVPFKVKIPAGVADGQKIRLRGRGRPSPDGGETGDIVVTVAVRPHPVFSREGLNLRLTVPVTFTEAALGATIEVPTLGGDPVRLRVAPGTPSGRVLRVKGRGIHSSKGTGDLLAEVQVAVPGHLDEAAREAKRLEFTRTERPFIAAGSTGSIPATCTLLKAIAGLIPRGGKLKLNGDPGHDADRLTRIGRELATLPHDYRVTLDATAHDSPMRTHDAVVRIERASMHDLYDQAMFLVLAEEAVYDVALNLNFEPFHIPVTQRSKDDPFAQHGYVGADFWCAAKIVNNGFCGVIEAGVTDL